MRYEIDDCMPSGLTGTVTAAEMKLRPPRSYTKERRRVRRRRARRKAIR